MQLRQLNLQLAFISMRSLRKNIQNQRRAVEHTHAHSLLNVALLRRGQLIVENAKIDILLLHVERQLLHLAAANEERRIRLRTLLQETRHNLSACGISKLLKLLK